MISPAAVSGSPALPKGLSGVSAVGNVESGGAEPHTGLLGFNDSELEIKKNKHQLHVYVWLKWLLHVSGEKRKNSEALTLEDAKRIRVMGDIPMELVNEVMMTITDPAAMLGPEVKSPGVSWLQIGGCSQFKYDY